MTVGSKGAEEVQQAVVATQRVAAAGKVGWANLVDRVVMRVVVVRQEGTEVRMAAQAAMAKLGELVVA